MSCKNSVIFLGDPLQSFRRMALKLLPESFLKNRMPSKLIVNEIPNNIKAVFKSIWAANLSRVRAMYIQGRGLKTATILSGNRTPCLCTEFNQAVRTPPT